MWTTLGLLFLLCCGMLTFSLGQRFYFLKNSKLILPKLEVFSAAFLCISMVLGGTLVYGYNPNLPMYTWLVMLLLLWGMFYFVQNNFSQKIKIMIQIALCTAGVFGVLMPLPQMNLLYWLMGIMLVLSWFVGWRIFTNFDHYPMVSSLVSTGWAVALLMVLFIFNSFPSEVGIFAGVLGVSVYVISRKRLSYGVANLGNYTAEISGFIWAGIWTICLLQTNISVLLLVDAYYIMELIIMLFQFLTKRPLVPLFMRALLDDKNRKKTISLTFSHIVLSSFLAGTLIAINAPAKLTLLSSSVIGFIVCANLYNHLKNLNHSVGSWKDIFSSLKGGISALPKASKSLVKEVKSGLKTQKRKKKTKVKKKGIKKKK